MLPAGADTMEAVGHITGDGTVTFTGALPGAGPYVAVDVSVDPDGGPSTAPGPSVVLARFA